MNTDIALGVAGRRRLMTGELVQKDGYLYEIHYNEETDKIYGAIYLTNFESVAHFERRGAKKFRPDAYSSVDNKLLSRLNAVLSNRPDGTVDVLESAFMVPMTDFTARESRAIGHMLSADLTGITPFLVGTINNLINGESWSQAIDRN